MSVESCSVVSALPAMTRLTLSTDAMAAAGQVSSSSSSSVVSGGPGSGASSTANGAVNGGSGGRESNCLRCGGTVYQMDKVGPLKDFAFFHNGCFKCAVCGTKLTLRTYFNNQQDQEDREVYCQSHVPKTGPGKLDGQTVGIKAAVNVPKPNHLVNEQIRAGSGQKPSLDVGAIGIKAALHTPRAHYTNAETHNGHTNGSGNGHHLNGSNGHHPHNGHHYSNGHNGHANGSTTGERNGTSNSGTNGHANQNFSQNTNGQPRNMAGHFDASALHIQHGLNGTKLQRIYNHRGVERPIEFLDRETQKKLEMRHRAEEDALYKQFAKKRHEEEVVIKQEIQEEWEKELEKLTSRFQYEVGNKKSRSSAAAAAIASHAAKSTTSSDEEKVMTLKHIRDKEDLEKNMTIKLSRKKETITRKLLEAERQATADLVEKQSKEMINLISEKMTEFGVAESVPEPDKKYPMQAPPPCPPHISKHEIYSDPSVFEELDQIAINVAHEDHQTFTDLVRLLTGSCITDVEKARAIFRWITVKNLNTMTFDDNVDTDTPMGILRGIKHGTESYHVLFKRLCAYAGLHCVVIKGYSKSAGYQPGVKFEDNRFRNSWNAVFVAGAWRFVQCNWGARHLVNAREPPKSSSNSRSNGVSSHHPHHHHHPPTSNGHANGNAANGKSDSLRYEYDDHYFLTDPKEFIYEFFPLQADWQLLKRPLSLEDFEELPFVRSLFFRYGLSFPDEEATRSVLSTDSSGAATVRIAMPAPLAPSLIFHYNLKFYDTERDSHDGVSLKRFVMQSVSSSGVVSFRVHAPCPGAFIMDIFANATSPREYVTGEPMKFKSVCKFKIICKDLRTVMVPLPDCASGEWGPMKGNRLFGLIPLTHDEALIVSPSRNIDLQFRMTRPLTDFMASLHRNGVEEKKLAKYVGCHVDDDLVTFFLKLPDEGQYGLDIYTREANSTLYAGDKQLLTHASKYLINATKR